MPDACSQDAGRRSADLGAGVQRMLAELLSRDDADGRAGHRLQTRVLAELPYLPRHGAAAHVYLGEVVG